MSGWRTDVEELNARSPDPSDPEFIGFIDIKDQHGNIYETVYRTPLGHWMSKQGPLPTDSFLMEWRESNIG